MKAFLRYLVIACIFCACHNGDVNNNTQSAAANKTADKKVLKSLQQQVAQYPDSAGLRLQFALALDSLQTFKPALQQMDMLIKKDSLNYGLWFTKGSIAEDAGDTLLALNCYSNAAHIYQSPDALLAMANLYAETKNSRAILLCSRVKALGLGRDDDANCAFITGVYYARIHDVPDALRYFDKCIETSYTFMEAYIEKGLLYFDEGQYQQALGIFKLASTVNNLYADAYYYQARCYEMMNKKDSAVLEFNQSLQIDPAMNEAREQLKKLNG